MDLSPNFPLKQGQRVDPESGREDNDSDNHFYARWNKSKAEASDVFN